MGGHRARVGKLDELEWEGRYLLALALGLRLFALGYDLSFPSFHPLFHVLYFRFCVMSFLSRSFFTFCVLKLSLVIFLLIHHLHRSLLHSNIIFPRKRTCSPSWFLYCLSASPSLFLSFSLLSFSLPVPLSVLTSSPGQQYHKLPPDRKSVV